MTLIARFTVDSYEPESVTGIEADWFGVVLFSKTFTAGLQGSATTVFLSSGVEGHRSYVAVEQITGQMEDGRSGTFIVQHGGLESDPSTWFGHIVPAAGSGDFAEWAGSARIQHDADGAFFEIDLTPAPGT